MKEKINKNIGMSCIAGLMSLIGAEPLTIQITSRGANLTVNFVEIGGEENRPIDTITLIQQAGKFKPLGGETYNEVTVTTCPDRTKVTYGNLNIGVLSNGTLCLSGTSQRNRRKSKNKGMVEQCKNNSDELSTLIMFSFAFSLIFHRKNATTIA